MIGRLRNLLKTVFVCGVVFIAAYAVEIGIDVWVVNHEEGQAAAGSVNPPSPAAMHVRYYVLPLFGFGLAAAIFLRRTIPAGRDALWTIEVRGSARVIFRLSFQTLAWTLLAVATFEAASWLQSRLFGFFLPP